MTGAGSAQGRLSGLKQLGYYFLMNSWFIGLGFKWNSLHRFILPAILPLLVGVGLQASSYSLLTTAGLIIAIIIQPISGAISDRSLSHWGRRRPMMVLWTIVDLLFLAGIAFAQNFFFLFLAYCGLQFSSNMAHGPAQGLIPDLVPKERRGTASGAKSFIDNFTLILAGLVTGRFLLSLTPNLYESMRITILVIAVSLVLFLIVNVLATREEPIGLGQLPEESLRESVLRSLTVIGNIGEVIRDNPAYGWLLVTRLVFLAGVGVGTNFGQFYFKDVILAGDSRAAELAPQLMGTLLVVVAIMLVIVSVPAGVLSDRFGRRVVSAIGGLLATGGAVLLPFVRNLELFQVAGLPVTDLTATGLLIGIGLGIFLSANWAWATDLISERDAARYLGIANLATAGGAVLGNIGGPIIDLGNRQAFAQGYHIAFAIGAALLMTSVIILPLIRETRGVASLRAIGPAIQTGGGASGPPLGKD